MNEEFSLFSILGGAVIMALGLFVITTMQYFFGIVLLLIGGFFVGMGARNLKPDVEFIKCSVKGCDNYATRGTEINGMMLDLCEQHKRRFK